MDFSSTLIQSEYNRFFSEIGEDDPYIGDTTIGIHEVLRAHFLLADYFYKENEGNCFAGIGLGPRSVDMLHSAVYRQFVGYDGVKKWTDSFDLCATLLFGLVKDHPFYDANKRTGLLTLLYHLLKLNRWPTIKQKELEEFVVEIAESKLSKYKVFKRFTKDEDPEIRYISYFLRKNTRKIDRRHYIVTYNQLNTILKKFGFSLENPHGCHIDVIKNTKSRQYFGVLGKEKIVKQRVTQIGFPEWTQQVGKGAINTVRKATQLTPEHGVDSQTFFQSTDPMPSLIAEYRGPLQRLADR
ncbi:MAG TPA: type II toxin-antitoxin system death-on-curing family toxin [Thiotrichaceae bacterium]|nr:type II toxin-antitoxin system death-on-curing family toxin [Thiotrichaceae bacterium]